MVTVAQLIGRAAAWYGDAPAVCENGRAASFREVHQRSNRLANALRALSPEAGARVAMLLPNRLEFVEIDFAIAKAGKVKLPINNRLVDREREYLLANSGAETLIFDPQFEPFVAQARERLPSLRHLIALDRPVAFAHTYTDLLEKASERDPDAAYPPEAPNFILYTSGTTGRPKGATSTNDGRLAAMMNMLSDELDTRPGDGMVHAGSMAHGSGSKVLANFVRGARNLPVAKFEADQFLWLVERERATASFMVPTMITMLMEAAETTNADLRSLRTISYGGAPVAPNKLQEALERFGNIFVQVYGSCEAPHPILVLSKADHQVPPGQEKRFGSLGREVTMAEVRLAGEDGNDVATGEPGEMWIRGRSVMRGYWDNPAATAEVFQDGWYKTGDVATRDEDGFYYMVDRARDMIISGGLNVYPAEVENALSRHPAVLEVAVIGVPDDRWGESVKAFVVLKSGQQATAEELIDHTRQHLAGYKKPRSVEFVAGLPKGSTGKILKRELQAPYWEGRARRV